MRICSVICLFLIFFLSSFSTLPPVAKPIFGFDKLLHAFAFGSLAFTFSYWFSVDAWRKKTIKCILFILIITVLYGASDEFHQYFVPGRSCSVYDWFADGIGACLAIGLRLFFVKYFSTI